MKGHGDEAARWFAASRRGVMLYDERLAFDAWRGVPGNAARLAALEAIWQELAPAAIQESTEAVDGHHFKSTGHRRQLAGMVGFMALAIGILPRVDGVWWNALDWWSR